MTTTRDDEDWEIYTNDENVFDEIWRDMALRAKVKEYFFQTMIQEGRITYHNCIMAYEHVGQMVDDLVSVDDGESIIFYGIDGEAGDPNNIAAQFFHDGRVPKKWAWESEDE